MGVVGLEFPGKEPKTRSSRPGKVNSGGIRRRQAFRRALRAERTGTGRPTDASPVTYGWSAVDTQIRLDTVGRYGGGVSLNAYIIHTTTPVTLPALSRQGAPPSGGLLED